jgi:hypothetical protein
VNDRPQRTKFLDNGGQRVILLGFEGITDEAMGLAVVAEAREFIGRLKPDGSHFTLTDVTRTTYNRRIVDAFKELTVHNRPFIKAAAIVSDSALHRAAISMIAVISRRKLEVFQTRGEALAWLATQR